MNRFDSPDHSYGTCYCGFTLECAFGESVLHDASTRAGGGFDVPLTVLEERWVIKLAHTGLRLAYMRGTDLLALGADGELSAIKDYDLPQQWSKAVYEHPAVVDGFAYTSKRVNDEPAVVLFDRAATRLVSPTNYRPYLKHPGRAAVHRKLKVAVV
jgi:RES domain